MNGGANRSNKGLLCNKISEELRKIHVRLDTQVTKFFLLKLEATKKNRVSELRLDSVV